MSKTSPAPLFWRRLWVPPRRAPASYAILVAVLLFAVFARLPATADPTHQWFALAWDQLVRGRLWTPLTALLLPSRVDGVVLQVLTIVLLLTQAERRAGAKRVLFGYFVLGGLSTLLGACLVGLLTAVGEPWASVSKGMLAGDPTIGATAALVYSTGVMSGVWRRRVLVGTGFAAVVLFLFAGEPGDLYRLIAFGLSSAVIQTWTPGRSTLASRRPASAHEMRLYAAALVLALAVGPLITTISRTHLGLLSTSVLMVDDTATQIDPPMCSVFKIGKQCWDWLILGQLSHHGAGKWMQLLTLIPMGLAAWGLARGRRAAVWISAAFLGRAVVSVAVSFVRLPMRQFDVISAAPTTEQVELVVQVSAVLLVHLAAAVWLIVQRRRFPITLGIDEIRPAIRTCLAILLAAVLATTGLMLAFRTSFARPPSVARAVLTGLELVLPPTARVRLGGMVRPLTPPGRVMLELIEILMWLALIVLIWRVLTAHPLRRHEPSDGEVRVRLRQGGGSTISFMATWPGNRHWQDPASGAIVAYRSVAGVALTLSEPFGVPGTDVLPVVRRFNAFADSQGLIPVWYAVTSTAFGPVARELGWQAVQVAQESIVHVSEWQTRGRKWQDVRTAISRAEREDVYTEWTAWADLTMGAYAQIVALSQDWVADHPLPEMGFTLGGLDELRDPAVRLMVAYGPGKRVQGVLSWLPSWRDERLIGWTLDFMRKRHDAMPGIMEFLIAQSAVRMKDDGMEFMSLSGAPLAHSPSQQAPAIPTADAGAGGTASGGVPGIADVNVNQPSGDLYDLLDYVGNTLEPVYGFSSLHHFKQKFQPEVRPWLMVFASTMNLPVIGLAVVRSYLPHLSVTQALRAVRELGDRARA